MPNNWEKFQSAYQSADSQTQTFIDSGIITIFLRTQLQGINLTKETLRDITTSCANRILNIHKSGALRNTLESRSVTDAHIEIILSLINDCVAFVQAIPAQEQNHTNTERREQLQTLSAVQYELYTEPRHLGDLFELAMKYQLATVQMFQKFHTIVGDVILGFYPIESTKQMLKENLRLEEEKATALTNDVLTFFAPLEQAAGITTPNEDNVQVNLTEADGVRTSSKPQTNQVEANQQKPSSPHLREANGSEPPVDDSKTPVATKDQTTDPQNTLQSVRTMQNDISRQQTSRDEEITVRAQSQDELTTNHSNNEQTNKPSWTTDQ